jgi:hypothetical protein
MPRILLVEDNGMNRDMLSRRLQRRGYEILVALLDGSEGDRPREERLAGPDPHAEDAGAVRPADTSDLVARCRRSTG